MRGTRCLVLGSGMLAASTALLFLAGGCGGGGGPIHVGPTTLNVSLDPNLDADVDGDVLATAIAKAELLDSSGAVVRNGTILSGGTAQFDATGLARQDYFLRINGLSDTLVPTTFDGQLATVNETVGTKLRLAIIDSPGDPTYRFITWPKGQGQPPVVKYSDGTPAPPERYAYTRLSYKSTPMRFQVRVLGTGAQLTEFDPSSSTHPGAGFQTVPAWLHGPTNHGITYGGNDALCSPCHGNLQSHPARWTDISVNNGWCYHCHFGNGGDGSGFVDPSQ